MGTSLHFRQKKKRDYKHSLQISLNNLKHLTQPYLSQATGAGSGVNVAVRWPHIRQGSGRATLDTTTRNTLVRSSGGFTRQLVALTASGRLLSVPSAAGDTFPSFHGNQTLLVLTLLYRISIIGLISSLPLLSSYVKYTSLLGR